MAINLQDAKRHGEITRSLGFTSTARFIDDLIAEIERLRAEATTTLVACDRCGRGVRARHMVLGMCPECAADEIILLKYIIQTYETAND